MKIPTKGRYGLRLMYELALNYEKGPINLKTISERQNISNKYLEQIVTFLNKAKLVKSIRGIQGGYILLKSPEEITVLDILMATDCKIYPAECITDENNCERRSTCPTIRIWKELGDVITSYLSSITLQSLILKNNLNILDNIDILGG